MTRTCERIGVLVLGLGNVLCRDDGVGIAAAHRLLRDYDLPGARVVDGGTLGLDLLALVGASDRVILVDAVGAASPPGTLVRLAGDDVAPAVYERLSSHQVGVADLLAGAALCESYPAEVVIAGVVPESTSVGMGLSDVVEASLPALVELVLAELRRLGVSARRRERPVEAVGAARVFGL